MICLLYTSIKRHAAYTGSCTSHYACGTFVETDGTSVTIGNDFYTYWFTRQFTINNLPEGRNVWLNFRGINCLLYTSTRLALT